MSESEEPPKKLYTGAEFNAKYKDQQFVKIMNKTMNSQYNRLFFYKDGLNDNSFFKFDPTNNPCGLYFTNKKNIIWHMNEDSYYLVDVIVPDDAIVFYNGYKNEIFYSTNKFILDFKNKQEISKFDFMGSISDIDIDKNRYLLLTLYKWYKYLPQSEKTIEMTKNYILSYLSFVNYSSNFNFLYYCDIPEAIKCQPLFYVANSIIIDSNNYLSLNFDMFDTSDMIFLTNILYISLIKENIDFENIKPILNTIKPDWIILEKIPIIYWCDTNISQYKPSIQQYLYQSLKQKLQPTVENPAVECVVPKKKSFYFW
jgi:hypothetical protein